MMDQDSHEYRLFRRREKVAMAGRRLPTEEELLRGMAFFRDDLSQDLREFGGRLARRLKRRQRTDLAPLVACLEELTVEPSKHGVMALEAGLNVVEDTTGLAIEAARRRCLVYRAGFGDPDAAAALSGEMARLALKDLESSDNPRMLWRALSCAAYSRDLAEGQRAGFYHRRSPQGLELRYELSTYSYQFKKAIQRSKPEEEKEVAARSDANPAVEDEERSVSGDVPPVGTVVVLREIGNASVSQGKQVAKEFEAIAGRPLPLPATPDLATARSRLVAEFPYAGSVVDQVFKGLVSRQHVRIRPTILLGPPGCGKSRFVRRLAEELGSPYEFIPCGGMSDGALGGTPRRWSSGEPSLPLSTVRRHECAGPIIILDEIEKVGTGKHNGNAHDVLLGLFEPETALRWHDPYAQASCDLSHLSWLMTANEVESIPAVLRDRCRVLRFPEPGPEHLPVLAIRIMERLYADLAQDPRWATPLEGSELGVVAAAWGGGSIRKLERILEQLVEVRDQQRPLH